MITKSALAAALLLASSAWLPASAGNPPTTFDVSLHGHCDVFTLSYRGVSVWGRHSGCKYKAVDGGSVVFVAGFPYIVANDVDPFIKKPSVQTWYFMPPATPGARGDATNQWFLYISNGKKQILKDQGTYTFTKPDAESPTPNAPPAGGEH